VERDDTAAVVVSRQDRVAQLTIDRPASRNSLSREVQAQIRHQLGLLSDDDGVRAVVLTGAGDRVFVAGADVRELREYGRRDGIAGHLQRLCDDLEQFPKPTIAAVNGYALGGGCEVALACDVRIAASNARFGLPETGLAIIPGAGGTQRLSRVVGAGRALEMILTGRRVTAKEALAMGLVSQVTEPGHLLEAAHEIARTIGAKGPLATQLARLVVRGGLDTDLRTGQTMERLAQAILHESADKQEGISAMLDKRTPRFEGR
jgi:enoyl-CoA hydratase/carnithine racemase